MLPAVTSPRVARARQLAGAVRRRVGRVRTAATYERNVPTDYVFIVTGGRSGSTLIQGLLNAMPRTLVRGENNFYLLPMFRAQGRVFNYKRRFGKDAHGVKSAHYGVHNFDLTAYTTMTRDWTVRSLLGEVDPRNVDRIGFKEVSWNAIRPDETAAFFNWFESVFPNARYVLNRRDPGVAIHSGHYRSMSEQAAAAAFRRVFDVQDFLHDTRPERTFFTEFEVVTGDDAAAKDEQLRGLATFVTGACSDSLLADLRAVTKVGHGPFPFGVARGGRVKS